MTGTADGTPDHIEARFNYLAYSGEKPVHYTYEPPQGVPWSNAKHESHQIRVHNLRPAAQENLIDTAGFELLHHESSVKDFWDEDEIKRIYYLEVVALLKKATGATRVEIFDHTLRRRVPGVDENSSARTEPRQPATRVHVDQTATSGWSRLQYMLPDAAGELTKHRFAIVNVWRPIKGPILDAPLAVCDARSVTPDDLIASDLLYHDRRGEIYGVTYNPKHRWFYAPAMSRDEVLLLKCFDSQDDGTVARFAPHTAFTDPTTPPDAAPRESIELRTYLFFGPQAAD